MLGGVFGIVGALRELRALRDGVRVPEWLWLLLALLCFSWAQFVAFHKVREQRDTAASARATLIQSVRTPLEIIRDEFQTGQALYFTGPMEEKISPSLREAIYRLRDEKLIRTFERIAPTLREFAATIGVTREEAGKRCMPQIEEMLARLSALEAMGPTQHRRISLQEPDGSPRR